MIHLKKNEVFISNSSEKLISFCRFCKKEISKCKHFCNTDCQKKFNFTNLINKIENNKEFPGKGKEASRRIIKKYIEYKYGDKCSICGIVDWNGKRLVKIVDHIDGDVYNNKIENFRLVCSNCDSQLETYKSKNRYSKREYRRKNA